MTHLISTVAQYSEQSGHPSRLYRVGILGFAANVMGPLVHGQKLAQTTPHSGQASLAYYFFFFENLENNLLNKNIIPQRERQPQSVQIEASCWKCFMELNKKWYIFYM